MTVQKFLWLTAFTVLLTAPLSGFAQTTFKDNFNRKDGAVGNGWTSLPTGCEDGATEILNKRLSAVGGGPTCYEFTANILRNVSFSHSVKVAATLTPGYSPVTSRPGFYNSGLAIGVDDTSIEWFYRGLQLQVHRWDDNTDNSFVALHFNGVAQWFAYSTFQFAERVVVSVTFDFADGRVFGTVSDDRNSFNFDGQLGQRSMDVQNFVARLHGNPYSTIQPTLDDLIIETDPGQSSCEAALPFSWPTKRGAEKLSADFAEFNGYPNRPDHYHTGYDIGADKADTAMDVLAAARGKVVYAGDSGNSRFQHVVILEHPLQGRKVYTQYGHLQSLNVVQGDCVKHGQKLGQTGGVPNFHLHFEVKSAPTISNPIEVAGACKDPTSGELSSTCFGYLLAHPEELGYFDPTNYMHAITPVDPIVVTINETQVVARPGPGSLSGSKYIRSYGYVDPATYIALATAPPDGKTSCVGNWIKIRHIPSDDCAQIGSCFGAAYSTSTFETIPDAWVCGDYVTVAP